MNKEEEIIAILSDYPMHIASLMHFLGVSKRKIQKELKVLREDKRVVYFESIGDMPLGSRHYRLA